MHRIALLAEADTTTPIVQALSDTSSVELKAAMGYCKCVYWLCKQELYFKALNVGSNVHLSTNSWGVFRSY